MELKNKYQYTYFIHTYIVNQTRYTRYICNLLKDGRFKLRVFQKDKDLELYTYFLPKIRNFMFKTFELNKTRLEKLNEFSDETKAAILAEYPCVMFECDLKKDIQGKTVDESSIFFKIQKMGIICFNTGICFLYFKTNVESDRFGDVLNFNYKFRDLTQEYSNLRNYDNIRVQTDAFEDIKELKEFISELTGPNFDALKLNLDVERFYTYGYECIDACHWNNNTNFELAKNDFLKYVNMIPKDKGMNISEVENLKIISKDKYSKIGISKMGVNLFSSDIDVNNYTVLPYEYENQYFYTYILSLYLKVYLKKIDYDFKSGKNLKNVREEFVEFTKNLWIQEITSEDMGSLIYQNIRESLETNKLYAEVKNKYDILYRELKVEKNEKLSVFIAVTLVITLIINILNWIGLFR